MSRIGKQPITVPKGTKVEIKDGVFVAQGSKGRVEQKLLPECPVKIEDGVVQVECVGESGTVRAKHGLMRALLANAVNGVSEGFQKQLEIVGVGYRGEVKGQEVHFFPVPEQIEIEVDRNNKITVSGADRQRVGQVAAEIRGLRPPDPYKAKGIRYSDEHIRRKVGKAGAK